MKNVYRYSAVLLLITTSVLRAELLPSLVTPLLPAPIKTLLDQEFPGWKYAPASKQVMLEFEHHHAQHPPWFLPADFSGDGQPDYVVQIIHGTPGLEEQNVIAYKMHDGSYEETVLESLGPNSSVYLWSAKQTFTGSEGANRLYVKDRLVIMGSELGETTYEYENGKFQEVSSVDETN